MIGEGVCDKVECYGSNPVESNIFLTSRHSFEEKNSALIIVKIILRFNRDSLLVMLTQTGNRQLYFKVFPQMYCYRLIELTRWSKMTLARSKSKMQLHYRKVLNQRLKQQKKTIYENINETQSYQIAKQI